MIITCPECEKTTNSEKGICEYCGVEIKVCSECGSVLKDGATICDYCGCSCNNIQSTKESIAEKETIQKMSEIFDYSNKIEKVLYWTVRIWVLAVFILLGIGFWKHSYADWRLVQDGLYLKIEHNIDDVKLYMVLGLVIGIFWILFTSFKDILHYSLVAKKIDQVNFNYHNFIEKVKLYEMDNSANFVENDNGTVIKVSKEKYCSIDGPIIYAINYKMNSMYAVLHLIRRTLIFIFGCVALVSFYLLVVINNDKLIQAYESYSMLASRLAHNQILTDLSKSDLNYTPYTIICGVCIIVGIVLDGIFNKVETKSNRKNFINALKTK